MMKTRPRISTSPSSSSLPESRVAPSLRRARARRRAGGAIIFVTAMTLALLASLGLYALSATRAEVRASGYMTRINMTEGIQSWALTAAMRSLDIAGPALIAQAEATTSYDITKPQNGCQSLATVPKEETKFTQACLRQPLAAYLNPLEGTSKPLTWSTPGRSYQADVDLFTEMTNVDEALTQPKGNGTSSGNQSRLVTLTTFGILRMHTANTTGTSPNIVHMGRAHLIVGGVPCNGPNC